MFLSERDTQAEYCDQPGLSLEAVSSNYSQLTRFNRLTRVADPFQRLLVGWLKRENVSKLSLLDLGAGDGSLAEDLETWAKGKGWDWRITSLDLNPMALQLGNSPRRVTASVCALPFLDNSFDVVMSSNMAHHLSDQDTVQHFREAWRVTRDALFLTDIHRNAGAFWVIWFLLRVLGSTPEFHSDGLQSVRRGWRIREWQQLAQRANIPLPRIWLYYGSRIMLQARKGDASRRAGWERESVPHSLIH